MATAVCVVIFNFSNADVVTTNTTGFDYLILPLISLGSGTLKLMFRPSFYRAAGKSAAASIEQQDSQLVTVDYAQKEFPKGTGDFELRAWVSEVAKAKASPKDVKLPDCDATDAALAALFEACPELKILKLSGSRHSSITDTAVISLSSNCPNLQFADLSSCKNITDASVAALTTNRELVELTLSQCSGITDAGLFQMAQCQSSQLKTIDLSNCAAVTDAGVGALASHCGRRTCKPGARHCTGLETIYLAHCSRVRNIGVQLGPHMRVWRHPGLPQSWERGGERFALLSDSQMAHVRR